jgi:ABC-type transporter MlaC component
LDVTDTAFFARAAAREDRHVVSRGEQVLCQGRAQESASAGDDNASGHEGGLFTFAAEASDVSEVSAGVKIDWIARVASVKWGGGESEQFMLRQFAGLIGLTLAVAMFSSGIRADAASETGTPQAAVEEYFNNLKAGKPEEGVTALFDLDEYLDRIGGQNAKALSKDQREAVKKDLCWFLAGGYEDPHTAEALKNSRLQILSTKPKEEDVIVGFVILQSSGARLGPVHAVLMRKRGDQWKAVDEKKGSESMQDGIRRGWIGIKKDDPSCTLPQFITEVRAKVEKQKASAATQPK